VIKMAKCIGRADCGGDPRSRGLCAACYARHKYAGTLHAYPTMQERLIGLDLRSQQPTAVISRRYRVRRYNERVWVHGYLVHPRAKHGHHNSYVAFGCRGPMCRAAQRWVRDTGQSALPVARLVDRTVDDCVNYAESGSYQ